MNYNIIKRNYDRGLWNFNAIAMAYEKGVISMEQFKDIVGDDLYNYYQSLPDDASSEKTEEAK